MRMTVEMPRAMARGSPGTVGIMAEKDLLAVYFDIRDIRDLGKHPLIEVLHPPTLIIVVALDEVDGAVELSDEGFDLRCVAPVGEIS